MIKFNPAPPWLMKLKSIGHGQQWKKRIKKRERESSALSSSPKPQAKVSCKRVAAPALPFVLLRAAASRNVHAFIFRLCFCSSLSYFFAWVGVGESQMGSSQSIVGGSSIGAVAAGKQRKDGLEGEREAFEAGMSSSSCRKVIRGLSLILSGKWQRRRRRRRGSGVGEDELCGSENKSWLLAEARGEAELAEAEPPSAHSSFRFSFGSQAEAEEVPGLVPEPAATVLLLVNLQEEGEGRGLGEAEGEAEARSRELQLWRRMEALERSISPVAGGLVRFSYADLRSATRDFSKGRELGRGALSRVYRGRIGAGRRAVAIKRVEGHGRESSKAFCRELMIASCLHHSNVVPLLGFCIDLAGLFLVYKFVSGGSLDHHLHQHEKRRRGKVLSWEVRYTVAVGVARAIEYLHYGTDKCVIHRDIKPSNILLSSKKTPKLCDFGLATWVHGPSLPFLCKSVKGTFGYLAPEYFQHGKLSDKTDVYAFGVVLLELITGRKAIDQSRPQGDENLVVWAKPLLQQGEHEIEKFVDPRLKPGSYRRNEMNRMVCTAAACINSEESGRPSINQVIGMLQTEKEDCSDWSFLVGNSCLAGYGSQQHEPLEKRDIKGHLALAMLGVSDTEDDDSYSR